MNRPLATSLIALTTALAAPAFADVTAADVWSNQQALYGATGLTLSGNLSGGTLSDPEINVILPQGVGSFQVRGDDISMTDNADGTVTITYPSPMSITIEGGLTGEGSFSAAMTMTHAGYTITASGNPGDIIYASQANGLTFDATEITLDAPGAGDLDVTGTVAMDGWSGETRVTEGNLLTYLSTGETGRTVADFVVNADNLSSTSSQITEPVQTAIVATLPTGGMDIMNMSAALRDGLSVAVETSGAGSSSNSETLLNGAIMDKQSTSTGPQTFAMSFTEDGFRALGEASDFDMTMMQPILFPGDLTFGISGISVNYDIPVNASTDAQDIRIATGLTGITMGEEIWSMFDPAQMLPRDPADITFDITGIGTSGVDLLDFAAMSQMFGPPPVQIDEVTIDNLRIAAAGAEVAAQGAMTFDWTDFNTIPGVPRPEGAVTVNLNGVNALMDTLSAMGLIPAEELMMPRMMMGMFATPVGDDMLESVIEINDQGHILANGQRLQ